MIKIIAEALVYTATLVGCPTGDMCRVLYNDELQVIRFEDFAVPNITSECSTERAKAITAATVTDAYMRQVGKVYSNMLKDSDGFLLVTAPELKEHFFKFDYARELGDTKGWCND